VLRIRLRAALHGAQVSSLLAQLRHCSDAAKVTGEGRQVTSTSGIAPIAKKAGPAALALLL
jgi:hypothetical protein